MLKSCSSPEVEDLRKAPYVRRLMVKPQKLEALAVLVSRAKSGLPLNAERFALYPYSKN